MTYIGSDLEVLYFKFEEYLKSQGAQLVEGSERVSHLGGSIKISGRGVIEDEDGKTERGYALEMPVNKNGDLNL